jgi:hypothetical protein
MFKTLLVVRIGVLGSGEACLWLICGRFIFREKEDFLQRQISLAVIYTWIGIATGLHWMRYIVGATTYFHLKNLFVVVADFMLL